MDKDRVGKDPFAARGRMQNEPKIRSKPGPRVAIMVSFS